MKNLKYLDIYGGFAILSYIIIRLLSRYSDSSSATFLYIHAYILFPFLFLFLIGMLVHYMFKKNKVNQIRAIKRLLFWSGVTILCLLIFKWTK